MPMRWCDYVAFREIVLFLWYELSAVWDSLRREHVKICQFVHDLTFIHENVLKSHLDDSTSNLDYVSEIFKYFRWKQWRQGKWGYQDITIDYIENI